MAVPTWSAGAGYPMRPTGKELFDDPRDWGGVPDQAPYDAGSQEPTVPPPYPTDTGAQEPAVPPPTGGPSAPVTQPTPNGGGGGIMDFINNLLGQGGGMGNLMSLLSSYYASQRSADGMEDAAGRYRQLGIDAANRASPVPNSEREKYMQRLGQLYEDPEAFLEGNPEYKATMKMGVNNMNRENAIRRKLQSGEGDLDRLRTMSDIGSRFIDKERNFLSNAAGFQFDPSNASRMMMEGGKLENEALIAALAAKLYPLGQANSMMQPPGGGGPGGSTPVGTAQSVLNLARQLGFDPAKLTPELVRIISQFGSNIGTTLPNIQGESPIPIGQGLSPNPFDGYDFGTDFTPVNNLPIADNDTDFGGGVGGDFGDFIFDDWLPTGGE